MNSCGLECGTSSSCFGSYECSFCLKKISNPKELHQCNHKNCQLINLCKDCHSVHIEAHYARDYPVSQLINNMLNLPLNKYKTIGNNMF
jgi:hypothetical protein